MPVFATPDPILVFLELIAGDVTITATDRADTTVEVSPTNPAKRSDVAAAEQTRVEFAAGRLLIRAPKSWRRYGPGGGGGSIDVQICLPTGSRVDGDVGVAVLRTTGRLGELHYKTGAGDIHVELAGPVRLSTGVGDIAVERVCGNAEVSSSSGALRIGSVDGTAVIKNSNGQTWIGEVAKDLRVVSANGSITVEHAHGAVAAKTANGEILLGEVVSGSVVASTALGKVEIGIREGVPAWLDLDTHFGKIHNELEASTPPPRGDTSVDVRARTAFGDITVRRALSAHSVGAA